MMEHTTFITKIINITTETTFQLIIPFSLLSIIPESKEEFVGIGEKTPVKTFPNASRSIMGGKKWQQCGGTQINFQRNGRL